MTYRAYRKTGKNTGLTADMSSALRGPVQPQPTASAGKLSLSTRPPGDVRPSSPRDVSRTDIPRPHPPQAAPHQHVSVGGGRTGRTRVPNRSGDPTGYNRRLFPNNEKALKGLLSLGYKVKSFSGKAKGDVAAIKKFQEDFNRCSRRFSFRWGTVSVNGLISPDTLRALEIALVFSRQRQKKMAMRGLNRSMAQCWHRSCKRSKKAGKGKSYSSTKRGRRGRRKGRMAGEGYGRRRGRGPGANPVLRPASSSARLLG